MWRRYIVERSCSYGKNCDYIQRVKENSPEELKLIKRTDYLEKVMKEKNIRRKENGIGWKVIDI